MNTIITSKDNVVFKELKTIADSSGINKYRKIIISGKKVISEIIQEKNIKTFELVLFEDYLETDNSFNEIIKDYDKKKLLITLKKSIFNEIDTSNTNGPLLIAESPDLSNWIPENNNSCILVLPFQNPINVGSCIRSAVAFGMKKIVILKDAANPFHPKSIRSSAGAVFKCKLFKGPTIEELLNNHKKLINLITLDMDGTDINSFSFPKNFILLPGIEGPGITKKIKHQAISIKMENDIESLNASVSVSITLYEWKRRMSHEN
jgi:RNA methyltransferase, TrmH family